MKRALITLFSITITLLSAQAQEVPFERMNLLTQPGEGVYTSRPGWAAGERRVTLIDYRSADGAFVRSAMVGMKGTDVQYLFNPYRDSQPPYYTDVKSISYKNKLVVSIQNVGPGGVDSIWVTDGTTAGTREIANIDPGPYPFIINDTLVLLTQNTAVNFVDLNTGAVSQIAAADTSATGYGLLSHFADGRGLFYAGSSLYVSDGTVAGTQVLKNMPSPHFGYGSSNSVYVEQTNTSPLRAVAFERGAFLSRDYYVLVTDGTVAGTREVPVGNFKLEGISPLYAFQLGSKLLYGNTTEQFGFELWTFDLVTLQASLLKDINPGSAKGYVRGGLQSVNKKFFFVANDGTNGDELWVSDGTTAGTTLTKDVAPGPDSGVDLMFYDRPASASVGQYFIFLAQPSAKTVADGYRNRMYPQELWASDGTADGTFRLFDPNSFSSGLGTAINDNGVLTFTSLETFGVNLSDGTQRWDRGLFLRFFDPSLGPPTSSYYVTVVGTNKSINNAYRLAKVGDYYYLEYSDDKDLQTGAISMIAAPSQLCAGSDFKVIPGQCGCGVEELPADSAGGVAPSNADSDGSAICLTPIGPIFVPASVQGLISGQLSQKAGQADSVQLTIPPSMQNALQMVTTAPNIDAQQRSGKGEVMTMKARSFQVQHVVSVVVLDTRGKSVKKIPMRKTSTGKLKIKLGRRLTSKQQLAFQYAVGARKSGRQLVQTPYKKSGAIKLTKARR